MAQVITFRQHGAVRFAEWLFFFLAADYFALRFPIPLGPSDGGGEMDLGLPFWAPAAEWLDTILQVIASLLQVPFLLPVSFLAGDLHYPYNLVALGLMQIFAAYFYAILLPRWWTRSRQKPGDLFGRDTLPPGKITPPSAPT